jgi:hypothetical protein
VNFKQLVRLMTEHDLELARQELASHSSDGTAAANKVRWGTV